MLKLGDGSFKVLIGLAWALLLGWYALLFHSVRTHGTAFRGEADDYTAPVASLVNDHDFAISPDDLNVYRQLFPEWAHRVDRFEFSSFSTRGGEEVLTWYFPLYSIASLPLVALLPKFGIPASYAFSYLNLLFLAVAMAVVWTKLRAPRRSRLLLIALLSIHPVVFYVPWASAEVFMYAFVIMALVFWHGESHGKAAFFMAVAAMLNPALLIASAAIVADDLLKAKRNGPRPFSGRTLRNLAVTMGCSLPAVIPLAYNFYHTGHANLTAAHSFFFASETFTSLQGFLSVLHRFFAYLFDLNFGFLPYFPVTFPMFFVLVVWCACRKCWKELKLPAVFFAVVAFYSLMTHINCGMSGISRYNAWNSAFFLFFVCLSAVPSVSSLVARLWHVALALGLLLTELVIVQYGVFDAEKTSWLAFTPAAQYALDEVPGLYSPLHSTFFVRARHDPDGDFTFATNRSGVEAAMPIIYTAKDGYVRKVLASSADRRKLDTLLVSPQGKDKSLAAKMDALGPQPRYLAFSKGDGIVLAPVIPLGEPVFFQKDNSDGHVYFLEGLSHPEPTGTWTSGRQAVMVFQTSSTAPLMHVHVDCHFFHHPQPVKITVNGDVAFNGVCGKDGFGFVLHNPGPGRAIRLLFELPEASSPASHGLSMDSRILALFVKSLVVTEGTEPLPSP